MAGRGVSADSTRSQTVMNVDEWALENAAQLCSVNR